MHYRGAGEHVRLEREPVGASGHVPEGRTVELKRKIGKFRSSLTGSGQFSIVPYTRRPCKSSRVEYTVHRPGGDNVPQRWLAGWLYDFFFAGLSAGASFGREARLRLDELPQRVLLRHEVTKHVKPLIGRSEGGALIDVELHEHLVHL